MTGQYLVFDIERLRSHMCRITEALLDKLEINGKDIREIKPLNEPAHEEITQLRIPIGDVPIV